MPRPPLRLLPVLTITAIVLSLLACRPALVGAEVPRTEGDELTRLVRLATEDLASRLGTTEALEIVAAEEVRWPDASLGCPRPGMMYAQVVTRGVRVLIRHDNRIYRYHGDTERVSLCEGRH